MIDEEINKRLTGHSDLSAEEIAQIKGQAKKLYEECKADKNKLYTLIADYQGQIGNQPDAIIKRVVTNILIDEWI